MDSNKNIRLFYIIIFFHNLIPAYVIERLFNLERGINIRQIISFEMIYAITVVLLEIPTGVLADKFDRKSLVIAGSFLASAEFIILIFAWHFWQFAIVAIIAGISGACMSGAWNALLYDTLVAAGKQNRFEKYLGRFKIIDFSSSAIAALSGSFLALHFGFTLNYWISFIATIFASAAGLLLIEPASGQPRPAADMVDYSVIIRQAGKFFIKNTDVLAVVIHVTLITACVNFIDELWQLYINEISIPLIYFGLVSIAATVIRAPGGMAGAWLIKYFRSTDTAIIASFIFSAGIVTTALAKGIIGVMGMAVAFFAFEVLDTITTGYLHQHAGNEIRATIESFASLIKRVSTIVLGLLFVFLPLETSTIVRFGLIGSFAAAVSVIYLFVYRRNC